MRSVTPPTEDALGDTIYEVSPGATAQRVSLGDTDRSLGVLVNEMNQGSSELVCDGGLKGAARSRVEDPWSA
jgi:hypothetical protein